MLECNWSCHDYDVDPDKPCCEDEQWKNERNCRGDRSGPVIFGGQRYDRCPVSWLFNHPKETALWEQYVDCCGSSLSGNGGIGTVIHLPFPGTVGEQPARLMASFRIFAVALQAAFARSAESDLSE